MGVDPPITHRRRSIPVYKDNGESLRRINSPMIHRMGSTLVYKGCGEYLRGVNPPMTHDSPHGVYTSP